MIISLLDIIAGNKKQHLIETVFFNYIQNIFFLNVQYCSFYVVTGADEVNQLYESYRSVNSQHRPGKQY